MDVKTAGRTVEMFENFAKARTPMTLSEIARALNAPQSSCFNLIRALEMRGYLYSVGGSKRLYPTRKLLDVAESIAGSEPVLTRIMPALEQLREESRETVMFGALQGTRVVYLAVVEGPQTIRYISAAGELKPIHASSTGKALLMTMAPAQRAKLLPKLKLTRTTEHTLTTPEALMADVEASEARGYTLTRGENVDDVMAVALPIEIDHVTYGVAIAGPIARMEPRIDEHVARLRRILAPFQWTPPA